MAIIVVSLYAFVVYVTSTLHCDERFVDQLCDVFNRIHNKMCRGGNYKSGIYAMAKRILRWSETHKCEGAVFSALDGNLHNKKLPKTTA